jgi:hypothetical protein
MLPRGLITPKELVVYRKAVQASNLVMHRHGRYSIDVAMLLVHSSILGYYLRVAPS